MNPTSLPSSHPPASPSIPRALTVVIVNYNSWPDVVRLVATLAGRPRSRQGVAEVVVVDNASQGPIPAELLEPPVRRPARGPDRERRIRRRGQLRLAGGPGPLAAPSQPRRRRRPRPGSARSSPASSVSRPRPPGSPGIVGFGLRNPDGSRQPSVGAFPSLPRTLWEQLIPRSRRKYQADWRTRPGPVAWVTGACMLVNTRLLAILGGMDEDFFLYYEEVALCRSACTRWAGASSSTRASR